LNRERVRKILTDDLRMRRISAKWYQEYWERSRSSVGFLATKSITKLDYPPYSLGALWLLAVPRTKNWF
jgi:hypothetical protein